MAVVDPSGLSSIVVDTVDDGPNDVAPPSGVRPARGLGRLGPIAVVVVCGLFFVLPLVAMARFSLQNVPMVRLGWSTLFDNWSLSGITKGFNDPEFRSSLYVSLRLAVLEVPPYDERTDELIVSTKAV
jgi:ABC-type Fe3+ transport system permease subunit